MYLDGTGLQVRYLARCGDRMMIHWFRLEGVPGFEPIEIARLHKDRLFFNYENTRLEDRTAAYRRLREDGWRYTGEEDGLRALERSLEGE